MDNPLIVKKGKIGELTRRVKVGFVGTCEKYYTNEKKYPMIRTTNLSETGINYEDLKYVTEEFYDKNKKSQLHDGDVLIARFGTSGTACVYHGGDAQCLNAIIVEPNCDNALPEYLAIVINSRRVREQINRRIVGSTQAILNTKVLSDIEIELPSLNEQKRICDILFSIRKTIAYRKDELAYFDELIKARFVEMFGSCPTERLGDYCSTHARIGWQKLTRSEFLTTGDYYLVTGWDFDVNNKVVDFSKCYYVTKERYEQDRKLMLQIGDVLLTKDGTLGKVAIVKQLDKPATLNGHIFVIRSLDGRLKPEFLAHALSSNEFKRQMEQNKTGSTIVGVTQKALLEFELPVPSIEQQLRFADLVKQVDKSKVAIQKSLDETQLLFDSLMQKYFG